MIVKCEQCQTRFKIPDEKVTEKGVKVRCTKCSHTFRVARDSAATAPGAPPAPVSSAPLSEPGFDPFERFGTAPEPKGVHVTRPGFFAEGVEASRAAPPPPALPPPPAPWNSADSGVEEEVFHETTRVIPLPVPPEARPPVPSLPPLPTAGVAPLTTPRPGQGLPGPSSVPFRPASEPAAGMPSVPSIAPTVSPVAARGMPTPLPASPAVAPAQRPATGQRPAAPAAPGAGSVAQWNVPRPGVKPLEAVPLPAPPPPSADLFTEFFAQPPGAPLPDAPLPDLPPPSLPGLPPVAATPAPAPAWPAPAAPSFGAADEDPFGSVSGDLTEPPPELGPPPEFDPESMFSEPAPAPLPVPVLPPAPAAGRPPSGRHPSLAAPAGPAPSAAGRPPSGRHPSAPAPAGHAPAAVGRPPSVPSAPAPAPAARAAPGPAPLPPAPRFSAPVSAAPFEDEDPFGSVSGDLSEPPPDLGPLPEFDPSPMFSAPGPAPAPVSLPAPLSPAPVSAMPFADEDPFGAPGVDLSGQAPEEPPGLLAGAAPMPRAQAGAGLSDEGFSPPGPMDFGMLGDEQLPSGPGELAAPAGMADPFAPPGPAAGMADPFAPPGPASGMLDPFAPPGSAAGMADPFAPPGPAAGMADPFAPPAGMADPFAPPAGMADPFAPPAGMADPFAPPAGMADPFAPPAGMADPFAAPASGPDPFAAPAPAAMADPFATAEPAFSPTATGRQKLGSGDLSEGFLTQTDTSHQVISPTDTGRALFDMPARPAAQELPSEEPASEPAARELIDLPTQPEAPPPSLPAPSLAAPPIVRPAGRPADMGIPERRKPSAAQQVTGQVAYLTIAAGLLLALAAVGGVYMKEGRVDPSALSPATLLKLMTPKEFIMRDVTNGLYETRGGDPLFYVRGEVENRASKPVRVKVRASLYEGGQRVKFEEGLAGMVPTPEELHAITSAEASAQLRARLDGGAALIPPGGRAPFTLVFQEYPRNLGEYRLKVTMEPVPEEGSRP